MENKNNPYMKTKRLFLAACLLGSTTIAFSQANTQTTSSNSDFSQGTNVINLGIGLGGYYNDIYTGYSSSPDFILSYDNCTFGNVGPGTISLGGLLAYKGVSYDYVVPPYSYNQNWNYYIIGFRAAFHWDFTSNPHFDPYVGLMLGYYDIGYSESSNAPGYNVPGNPYYYANDYNSYLALSVYIGARYFVSDHVGLWLELGYGYSDAALGISFRF